MSKLQFSILMLTLILSGCQNSDTKKFAGEIKIDTSQVIIDDFIGIGIQISAYPWYDLQESDWEKVRSRIKFTKIPFTRIMVDMTDFCGGLDKNGIPVYTFENNRMQKLYKLLDFCEEENISVMLGQWGAANTARNPESQDWNIPVDSDLHAQISVEFIKQIITIKNYQCVKWYNLINEPNGDWSSINGDWNLWKTMILKLRKELINSNLDSKIQITGPDNSGGDWHRKAMEDPELRKTIGMYDRHLYAWNESDILSENLEKYTAEDYRLINMYDKGKPIVLGELGFLDGKNELDQQLNVKKFWYGVSMADAAIQLIRGGSSGFLAWYLDDAMHYKGDSDGPAIPDKDFYEKRKVWGMWNIVGSEHGEPEDENLRPWFYTWSILSRIFPAHCQTLKVDSSNIAGVRVAAAIIKNDTGNDLSIAVVNNSDTEQSIKLSVPGWTNPTLFQYNYTDINEDDKVDSWPDPVDENGIDVFPEPDETQGKINPEKGINLTLHPKSVVLLTSMMINN